MESISEVDPPLRLAKGRWQRVALTEGSFRTLPSARRLGRLCPRPLRQDRAEHRTQQCGACRSCVLSTTHRVRHPVAACCQYRARIHRPRSPGSPAHRRNQAHKAPPHVACESAVLAASPSIGSRARLPAATFPVATGSRGERCGQVCRVGSPGPSVSCCATATSPSQVDGEEHATSPILPINL